MSSIGDWYLGPGDRWVYDPNAPAPSAEVTRMQPVVAPIELDALHGDDEPADEPTVAAPVVPRVGDVGDWIDPNADDPTPDEITDPDHPDYVEPWKPEDR